MPTWTEEGGTDKIFLEPKLLNQRFEFPTPSQKTFKVLLIYWEAWVNKITNQFGQCIERTLNKTAKTINKIYAGSKSMLKRAGQ